MTKDKMPYEIFVAENYKGKGFADKDRRHETDFEYIHKTQDRAMLIEKVNKLKYPNVSNITESSVNGHLNAVIELLEGGDE